ncbi:Uncharacterised protein [Mannheimia haemolytica]|uniref:Uncharacterized protein n=1 Tax=Mannheimia haemolytica TaxID=75985 RepID=A0A378N0C7_MANHA|nr:Uncharacterised protein [Mannheimia haemolytica]
MATLWLLLITFIFIDYKVSKMSDLKQQALDFHEFPIPEKFPLLLLKH